MRGFANIFAAVTAIGLLSGVWGVNVDIKGKSTLSFDVEAAKERPVTKVITLLKDMLATLEKEAAEDEEIYDKLACWCSTNDKEKTAAIAAAEDKIAGLTSTIEELSASSARLSTEIKNLKDEVAANEDDLAKATAIREKELAEFNAEEKDSLESIAALKAAITVLGEHHSSLLQTSSPNLKGAVASVQHLMQKHRSMLAGVLTYSDRKAVSSFVQSTDYFDSAPTFKQSYAPQSGQIFGILKQMKETFETNLSASQKEEAKRQKEFEDVKAAKETQIAAGKNQLDKKTLELADTDDKKAQAEEDIADTKSALTADEQFLLMLKEKCSATDAEWEERQKTRQMEMAAVSKAIEILSADDAHDVFTKTFNPSLLQKEASLSSDKRSRAAQVLAEVAKKTGNPRLAVLATNVKLDAFVKVIKAIDDMVAELMKQKADEIKKRDYCTDELFENKKKTDATTRTKEQTEAKMKDLELAISTLTGTIDGLKADIASMNDQLKKAGENRAAENKDFQETVADQRETQRLLKKALEVLKGFYAKGAAGASLMQSGQPAGPPPPPGFAEYKNSAASGGVMGMLQQIIDDAAAMEKESLRGEEEAQAAYDAFVAESKSTIEVKTKAMVDASDNKAKAEGDLVEEEQAKDALVLELEGLTNTNTELHQSCDFLMKNFELRQTARDQEVEALKQAKAILKGAKFQEFLQRKA